MLEATLFVIIELVPWRSVSTQIAYLAPSVSVYVVTVVGQASRAAMMVKFVSKASAFTNLEESIVIGVIQAKQNGRCQKTNADTPLLSQKSLRTRLRV